MYTCTTNIHYLDIQTEVNGMVCAVYDYNLCCDLNSMLNSAQNLMYRVSEDIKDYECPTCKVLLLLSSVWIQARRDSSFMKIWAALANRTGAYNIRENIRPCNSTNTVPLGSTWGLPLLFSAAHRYMNMWKKMLHFYHSFLQVIFNYYHSARHFDTFYTTKWRLWQVKMNFNQLKWTNEKQESNNHMI